MSGWVAGAVAVGAIGGAVISSDAAKSAANTQASADENATQAQLSMFNTIQGQEQPFMNAGVTATNQLNSLTAPGGYLNNQTAPTFNANTVTNSPGYQFAQQQGLSQVANAEAPNVGALSGPALKALTNFSSGTAAQYYNDYFNQANTVFNQGQTQQQNIFSRLSTIAGIGQNAASNTGTAGAALGTGAAQSTAAAGAASAAGTVGLGNALSSGVSSVGNATALGSILNNNSNSGGATANNNTPQDLIAGYSGS
jgi:hypothetical protein